MKKIVSSLVVVLWMGVAVMSVVMAKSPREDLEGQLSEVRSQLKAAEDIPGKAGLDQVKYFTFKQQELEKALEAQGVPASAFENTNTPWSLQNLKAEPSTALGLHTTEREPTAFDTTARALEDVERQIDELTQRFDDPKADQLALSQKLNTLLEQRYLLTLKKEEILEHPGEAIVAQDKASFTQEMRENLAKKDPVYIRNLQDELQQVYERIYVLRAQAIALKDGARIQENGQAIATLEKKERMIKTKLKGLGVKPLAPEVLDKRDMDKVVLESDPVIFHRQLLTYDKELAQRMNKIQHEIKKATSGAQIVQLGQQMSHLQTQRALVQRMLKSFEKKSSPVPETPTALPHVHLTAPWGQATNAPRFFIEDKKAPSLPLPADYPPAARPQGSAYKLWSSRTSASARPIMASQSTVPSSLPMRSHATLHALRSI